MHSQTQTSGCFGAVSNYSVHYNPLAIVSADFNGDNKMDLATVNGGTNQVSVLLGVGNGTFNPAISYQTAFGDKALTTADFNGDGNVDLAMVNGGNVQLLMGTGTGSFAFPSYIFLAHAPMYIIAADFNNDGKPDIATVNSLQNFNISVVLNTGNNTFAPEVFYSALGAAEIAAGDFNGDGNLDIAIGRSGQTLTSSFSVLYGTGTGTFSAVVHYPIGIFVNGIIVADFNSDGKSDLAMTSEVFNDVFVALGTGTGSFVTPVSYPVGTFPNDLKAADLNGDGKLDLAVSNYSSNNVSVLYGSGNGGFGASFNYSLASSPTGITAADFNGDGKSDLALSLDYYTATVLLNTSSTISITASTASLCVGGTCTLNVSGANTYTWVGGPGASSYVVSPLVSTIYSVSGTNSVACISNTATLNVLVKPLPSITFSTSNAFVCLGDSTAIVASGASSYLWNTGAQTPVVSFIASNTSSYSVIGTSSLTGCTASAVAQISVSACTGVSNLQLTNFKLTIFPNPTRDKLEVRIENANPINTKVEILNALGEVLKTQPSSQYVLSFDISQLQGGIYFLRVNNHIQKFVKE